MRQAARTEAPSPHDRRSTDQASHAHKRTDDDGEFARLHKRIDDSEHIQTELIKAKFELFGLMKETNVVLSALAKSQLELVVEMKKTAKWRAISDEVDGMMAFLARINNGISVVWKPLLFVAVLGGAIWMWATGSRPPP